MLEPGAASAAPGSSEGAGAPETQGLRGLEPPQGRAASAAWPALPHHEAETKRTPEAGAEAPPSAPGQGHRLTGRARDVCRRQSASADPGERRSGQRQLPSGRRGAGAPIFPDA